MFVRVLFASLRARRGRIVLALLSVTLGVAVATALGALALEAGDDLARTLRAAGPNFVVLPAGATLPTEEREVEPARAGVSLPDSSVALLRDTFWKNSILEAAPELTLPVRLDGRVARVTGTWFRHEVATTDGPWSTGLAALRPRLRLEGRWPREGEHEIALGSELARSLGRRPGQRVALESRGEPALWLVSAVVRAGGTDDERAWIPLAAAQELAARPREVDAVWLSALVLAEPSTPAPDPSRDPEGYERFMCTSYPSNVARDLAERITGSEVRPMTEVVAGEARVVGRLNFLMLLLALAALTASTLGLLSTTAAAVVERQSDLGLLRSLGASGSRIAALLLGESLIVALAGGFAGWVIGAFSAAAIRGGTFGGDAALPLLLLPPALVVAAAVGVLGTLAPIRIALRFDPATVLRG